MSTVEDFKSDITVHSRIEGEVDAPLTTSPELTPQEVSVDPGLALRGALRRIRFHYFGVPTIR